MWHFGVDTRDVYTSKEFEISFQEGISGLLRIYTKHKSDGKTIVRTERQEYPNLEAGLAFLRKFFPNGHLIDPNQKAAGSS
jgi:hypothetical protein